MTNPIQIEKKTMKIQINDITYFHYYEIVK